MKESSRSLTTDNEYGFTPTVSRVICDTHDYVARVNVKVEINNFCFIINGIKVRKSPSKGYLSIELPSVEIPEDLTNMPDIPSKTSGISFYDIRHWCRIEREIMDFIKKNKWFEMFLDSLNKNVE